jgi:hypothetical protein
VYTVGIPLLIQRTRYEMGYFSFFMLRFQMLKVSLMFRCNFGAIGKDSMEKVEIIDDFTARYGGYMDLSSHI